MDGDVVVYRPREVRFRVPSYYGPWGLSALGDRERAKYVRNDCPIPEPPLGYQWSKDYKLIKETALR